MNYDDLDAFSKKVIKGFEFTDSDLEELLKLSKDEELEKLFYVSRKIRNYYFGNKVFLYSFIYYSTYCKNKCTFCYYNESNSITRYRLSTSDIIKTINVLKNEGIHMIDMTMGEDPYYHSNPVKLVDLIKAVKKETNLPLMISPGVIDSCVLKEIHDIGANFYALYQETYDPMLYKKLRIGQSYQKRIDARNAAKNIGFLIEDGILTGIESSVKSLVVSLRGLQKSNPDMVRSMTFVPQPGTPFENKGQNTNKMELKIISILRLLFPDRLIPASLDLEGIHGMVSRLDAGANVVTSILPNNSKLEGVVNYDRDFEVRERSAKNVISKLEHIGLRPAPQSDFNRIIGI